MPSLKSELELKKKKKRFCRVLCIRPPSSGQIVLYRRRILKRLHVTLSSVTKLTW